ncbi:MAG: DUF6220 domain-containing protein [Acidimicrobiales bacterium]
MAFVGFVWLYLLGIGMQVFLAGMALFAGTPWTTHAGIGYLVHLTTIPILIAALLARLKRPMLWWAVALFVVGFVQPLLPSLRAEMPLAAALHPVLAFAAALIAGKLAVDTWPMVRDAGSSTEA